MLHVEGSHHRLFTFILLSFLLLLGATPVESSDTNRISTDPYHHISRLPLFQETIAGKQHENPGNDEIFVNQYLFGFHQTKFGSGYHFSIKENLNRHKRRFFEVKSTVSSYKISFLQCPSLFPFAPFDLFCYIYSAFLDARLPNTVALSIF